MSSIGDKKLETRVMRVADRLAILVDSLSDALKKLGTELREIETELGHVETLGALKQGTYGITPSASSESLGGNEVIQVKSIAAADRSLGDIGDTVLRRQVDVIESPAAKSAAAGEEETQIIKMTLAGYGAVGKTTIFKLLKGVAAPAAYFPTIGANVDREDIVVRNARIRVWDLAGQEQYHRTWPIFLRNSKLVLLVTDSSKVNVERSKNLINLVRTIEPKASIVGIANKQDLPDRLSPHEVESLLGVKTHGLVAVDTSYRDKIIEVTEKAIAEIRARES
ncbi:MAG: ADP-ribosylation factor-like protein [Candidatus Atabeyarchaeum deiterrae]